MPVVQFQKNFFSSPGSLCTAIFFPSLCAPSYAGISWPLVKATFSFRQIALVLCELLQCQIRVLYLGHRRGSAFGFYFQLYCQFIQWLSHFVCMSPFIHLCGGKETNICVMHQYCSTVLALQQADAVLPMVQGRALAAEKSFWFRGASSPHILFSN